MIINGRQIAEEIIQGLHGNYTLGVVMGTDAASDSFVRMKEKTATRIGVALKRFSPEQIEQALECDGVLVQLPLPNSEELIKKIPPQKDVDALGEHPLVHSPVAGAIKEVLVRTSTEVVGKTAVVVGAGKLVGAPAVNLLRELGAHVSVVTTEQGSIEDLKNADIVVLGVGKPGFIAPHMLKMGVVLIDAGTSESAGVLRGDADPLCAEVASIFTPVPGGIGPIAVAMIFKNLFTLKKPHG